MAKILSQFFIFCSGAVTSVLSRCPSDYIKYQGIGATIFFTGVMSSMAAGYALYTVFNSIAIAIPIALVWGLMIFNLDRYIVSGMRKKSNLFKELAMALPRVIIAVFIGIVIATPFELKIFESEINGELVLIQQEALKSQADMVSMRYMEREQSVLKEINDIKSKLSVAEFDALKKESEAIAEADGTGGSKIRNMGKIFLLKKNAAAESRAQYEQLKLDLMPKLEIKNQEYKVLLNDKDVAIQNASYAALNGFASRMKALHRLNTKEEIIRYTGFFLTLLFLLIECAPIIVKLISERTPYDYKLERLENMYAMQNTLEVERNTLQTKSTVDFEKKTAGFRTFEKINAENEVFAHALLKEKENLINQNKSWIELLKKKRIFDF